MSAQAEEGTLRRMTLGEIAMARRVFGDSIVYSRVWIHCDSYLPFGLQKQNYAMTPNGSCGTENRCTGKTFPQTQFSLKINMFSSMNWGMCGNTSTGNG